MYAFCKLIHKPIYLLVKHISFSNVPIYFNEILKLKVAVISPWGGEYRSKLLLQSSLPTILVLCTRFILQP